MDWPVPLQSPSPLLITPFPSDEPVLGLDLLDDDPHGLLGKLGLFADHLGDPAGNAPLSVFWMPGVDPDVDEGHGSPLFSRPTAGLEKPTRPSNPISRDVL